MRRFKWQSRVQTPLHAKDLLFTRSLCYIDERRSAGQRQLQKSNEVEPLLEGASKSS